jgi:hypothetical protein
MCGPHSALGLDTVERARWPYLREQLRRPGASMGMMRSVLGGDTEVAVVVATTPGGVSTPLAVVVSPVIAAELTLPEPRPGGVAAGFVGPYEVQVLCDPDGRPAALLMSPWLFENLSLYARKLWVRH